MPSDAWQDGAVLLGAILLSALLVGLGFAAARSAARAAGGWRRTAELAIVAVGSAILLGFTLSDVLAQPPRWGAAMLKGLLVCTVVLGVFVASRRDRRL